MGQPVQPVVPPSHGVGPRAGQPPQGHGEHQDKHQGQPELGDAAGGRTGPAQQAVQGPVLVPGAQNAQQHGQEEDQEKANPAQQQGVADPAGNHLRHVHLVFIGDPEVPPEGPCQPADVLDGDGLVEPQTLLRPGPLRRAHLLHPGAVIGGQGVSRGQPGDVERRQGQYKHAEHKEQGLFPPVDDLFPRRHPAASFPKIFP